MAARGVAKSVRPCVVCRKGVALLDAAAVLVSGGRLCSQACVVEHARRRWPGGDPI